MSAPESRAAQQYGTIVVVGGGCYGSYYARQLSRAIAAHALTVDRVLIVDRDPQCAVAGKLEPPFELELREWSEFFATYLDTAIRDPCSTERDAVVPSPLMPHLMGDWLVGRARQSFGERVSTRPLERIPDVPWDRAGADGTHYVSFATWMCPINCVEPRTCPHTRTTRGWSTPVTIATHASAARDRGEALEDAVLFCRHRTFGVGMFDTAEVVTAHRKIQRAGAAGAAEVLIGTVSHCHGALTRLVIDPNLPAIR